MFSKLLLYLTVLSSPSLASPVLRQAAASSVWNVSNYQNLIAFGDSYTDENRLSYIFQNNGTLPPNGTFFNESFSTASGGRIWPRYVVQYAGSNVNGQWKPQLELYDYAVAGAVCSNKITPRYIGASLPGILFPSVLEYEVPAYIGSLSNQRNGTTQPYFTTTPTANNSLYALWIGTNDLGAGAFLTDSEVPGHNLTSYTDCVYTVFDRLYATGARVFVLMNTIPLNLAPLYANATLDGADALHDEYWPTKPANATISAETIGEYTSTVNTIFQYQTPFEVRVANRYPDASFAVFDVHSLWADMYAHPTMYLNGTQPANVTGYEHECTNGTQTCVNAFNGSSSDSFLWYDTLHPSEQSDRVIARNFIEVMNGTSKYATYW